MGKDNLVRAIAALLLVACLFVAGKMLPGILEESDAAGLRYTNVSVENAPPFVVLGTAIGAVRGLIVDYLWIKVNMMKEKGQYYEIRADADLITKLQPRFPAVWAFHAHNMTYNISVAANTLAERWEWVNMGIQLLRNEGLRYNPNDMVLHRELSFFFAHKIEGVSDDAHLYYKTRFCQEWHLLLGAPPVGWQDRIAWIKAVADAPNSINIAETEHPAVKELVTKLEALYPKGEGIAKFQLGRDLLTQYVLWQEITNREDEAKVTGDYDSFRQAPFAAGLYELGPKAEYKDVWPILLNTLRKSILLKDYNMDPELMYEYTRDVGPLDWRHGASHSLYWARRGSQLGAGRVKLDNVYEEINTDRLQIQAMQDLARWGRITYDPLSQEMPGRYPDQRWIDPIENQFEVLYKKYFGTRGAGGETFIAFLQNFMGSAIRQWYRAGEIDRAQKLLDKMDKLFPQAEFAVPLDVFVRSQTLEQYQAQPHLAPGDLAASLQYGIRVGIGGDNPDVWKNAVNFANQIVNFFKTNDWNNYANKFGYMRMADIIQGVEDAKETALLQFMTDPTFSIDERMNVWGKVDKYEPTLRGLVYSSMKPLLQQEFGHTTRSKMMKFDDAFPAPPNLDAMEKFLAERKAQYDKKIEEARKRDTMARQH
ncbi:MAG TPA: hypothetical protein VG711_11585 [Phycisphaerales bacterium]|nr:hypothetical protein [Phycisphaerales bacterium]